MNTPSSFGIAKRLYAACAALSVLLAGLAAFALVELNEVSSLADRAGNIRVPQMQRVAAVELDVTRASLQLRHAMLARTPDEMAAALNAVGDRRKRVDQALADYEKALDTAEGKQQFAGIPPLVAKFWEIGTQNIQLIQAGNKSEAFAFLVDKTIPARNALLTTLEQTVKFQEQSLRTELDVLNRDVQLTLKSLLAAVFTTMVGLIVFNLRISRLLRRRVAASRAVAERVRDGDLATPVSDGSRDEFSPLLSALGEMQASLTRVVSAVRGNAESVATASAEIAQGNQDLSRRTEQQASALQQTSATMEQLGATVQNNAECSKQASQLAHGASDVAGAGGTLVAQVVQTMEGINESSRKIADIIAVIDGIAFQTNILALNAAVEAARAGEQGRGFAVVASEVRNLAHRSADAAKQIKSLITNSVEQVDQGTRLVGRAGSTMQEIVGSIQRVTDIVGEISAASVQQSGGVSQVGQAVSQMDQATQQNAALVEQSAAAAESLRQQALQLVKAVSVFKLAPA